jgi:hypothetical protein
MTGKSLPGEKIVIDKSKHGRTFKNTTRRSIGITIE